MLASGKPKKQNVWVLLRGLAREQGHWEDFNKFFEEELNSKLGPTKVICIDLPGVGEYRKIPSPLSMGGISEFVRSQYLLKVKDIEIDKAYIFALSLGGMVATEWMYRYPEDFSGGVLVNTSFSKVSKIWERLTPKAIKALTSAAKAQSLFERERIVLDITSQNKSNHSEIAKKWEQLAIRRPIDPQTVLRQLVAASRFRPKKQPPQKPVLILNSAGDELVNPQSSVNIGRYWGYNIHRHPSAGHDLTFDAPGWASEQVIEWLNLLAGNP